MLTLVYDHRCLYCRGFIRAVKRLDRKHKFSFLPVESKKGKLLLRAQFGKKFGFALYVFTPSRVYWGPAAANHVMRAVGFPKMAAKMAEHLYPSVVKQVSRITRRKKEVTYPLRKTFSAKIKLKAKRIAERIA